MVFIGHTHFWTNYLVSWQTGDVAGGRFLLEDFRHFFTQQLFGEKEGKDKGTFGTDH